VRPRFEAGRSRVCVITDSTLSRGRSHEEVVRAALAGGADHVQLRDKTLSSRRLYELGLLLRKLTLAHGALFFVNDRPDIAAAVEADGVHLGAEDLPVDAARRLFGRRLLVGASARTVDEAIAAAAAGADYLGLGPVFEARGSKPDAVPPGGVELVRAVRAVCRIPILAIGGIHAANVEPVIRAGASGVAVISAIVAAEHVSGAAERLRDAVLQARVAEPPAAP
jgi:thiamine-phosphate pyrophosphorylase